MELTYETPVRAVVLLYPDAEDVLLSWGVDLSEVDRTMTLGALCRFWELDLDDLLLDLADVAREQGGSTRPARSLEDPK